MPVLERLLYKYMLRMYNASHIILRKFNMTEKIDVYWSIVYLQHCVVAGGEQSDSVYTHIYLCAYIYECMCIYTPIYIYIYMNVFVYIYTCIYMWTYVYIYTYIYIYEHVYIYIYTPVYIYVNICVYIYTSIYIWTYVCIHMWIYIYLFRFFSLIGYYKRLSIAFWALE